MAFQAGAIVSQITLDRSKFSASVKAIGKQTRTLGSWVKQNSAQFKKMGLVIAAMGTAALLTFKKMVAQFVETGDWIDKMSKRTGFSAEALSELAYAADISGASLNDIEKSVKRMARTITDAGEGLESYLRPLKRMGLEVEDLKRMAPEQQFTAITEAMAALEDPTLRAATAQEVFGRAGTTLLPLMAEGKEGLKKLREEAHLLGIVFDEETAKKAADLKDAQTALKGSVQGLSIAILTDLIPVITDVTKEFTDWFVESREGAKNWAKAIIGFFKVIALGVEGMMLAFHAFKLAIFKSAEEIAKMALELLEAAEATIISSRNLALMMKLLPPLGDAIHAMTVIQDAYKDSADDSAKKITNIVFAFNEFFAMIDKVSDGLKTGKKDLKGLGDTIGKDLTPKAREFYGVLGQVQSTLESYEFTTEKVLTANEKLMESWGLTTEAQLTFSQAAINEFVAMEASIKGFVEAILGTFEKWAIGQIIPKIMAALPFPFNLLATGGAILAIKTIFKGIRGMEGGGRLAKGEPAIVGEAGPELFAPATPGAIIPLPGDGARQGAFTSKISMNFYAPLISTTGLARADLERAGNELYRIIEMQARRRGYTL